MRERISGSSEWLVAVMVASEKVLYGGGVGEIVKLRGGVRRARNWDVLPAGRVLGERRHLARNGGDCSPHSEGRAGRDVKPETTAKADATHRRNCLCVD